VKMYANITGLPLEDDHIWKGEMSGHDRAIHVRPSDANYFAGKYHITIVSESKMCDFAFSVHVAPYTQILREADLGKNRRSKLAPLTPEERSSPKPSRRASAISQSARTVGFAEDLEDNAEEEEDTANLSTNLADTNATESGEQQRIDRLEMQDSDAATSPHFAPSPLSDTKKRSLLQTAASRAQGLAVLKERGQQKSKAAETKQVLTQIALLSDERKRKSAIGARVPPKATVLRPQTAMNWDDARKSAPTPIANTRPQTVPLPPVKTFQDEKA